MAGGATTLSEYESAMFMELLEENSLFVTAKYVYKNLRPEGHTS